MLDEAEAYAARDYPWVLSRGDRLSSADRSEAAATVARLTGLSEDYVERADLRIEHLHFFTELLRDRGLATGRLDARFTGPLAFGNAEQWDADPSMDAISGAYAAAFNHYVRTDLGYESDLAYRVMAPIYETWTFKEFEAKPVDVTVPLSRAMRANPHLRVRIEYGYYDLATPYGAAEDTVAHLRLPDGALDRIEHAYFETGHMPYVGAATRAEEAEGITDFVRRAAAPG